MSSQPQYPEAVPQGASNITMRFTMDSRYRPELYGGNSCRNATAGYNCTLCLGLLESFLLTRVEELHKPRLCQKRDRSSLPLEMRATLLTYAQSS